MAESNPTESALLASKICNQISSVFSTKSPNPAALDVLVQEIADAANRNGRVFLYGVGREGLMLKALSMRLFHLGLSAHCVFDMNTPPIGPSDLLISSAGPGGFSTVDAISGVAKSSGARVLLLTAQPDSGSSMKYASAVAYIPAQTMADDNAGDGEKERPLLPMGSVYEGAMFVLFEMVVFKLGEILKQSPEAVRARHTNLEEKLQQGLIKIVYISTQNQPADLLTKGLNKPQHDYLLSKLGVLNIFAPPSLRGSIEIMEKKKDSKIKEV